MKRFSSLLGKAPPKFLTRGLKVLLIPLIAFSVFFMLFISNTSVVEAAGGYQNGYERVYEVTDISNDGTYIHIKGWFYPYGTGYNLNAQGSTHTLQVRVGGLGGITYNNSGGYSVDHTNFNHTGGTTMYNYKDVGFHFKVPIVDLINKGFTHYGITLIFNHKTTGVQYTVDAVHIASSTSSSVGGYTLTINNDSSMQNFYPNYAMLYVRTSPNQNGAIAYTGDGVTPKFWYKGSDDDSIYKRSTGTYKGNKSLESSTKMTWYNVMYRDHGWSTNDGQSRYRIKPWKTGGGGQGNAWIGSASVDYSATPTSIVVKKNTYTNYIVHWKYVGSGGDSPAGDRKSMGTSTFSGTYGNTVTVPSSLAQSYTGYYVSGVGSGSWGTWKSMKLGDTFTQPAKEVHLEYYYDPYQYYLDVNGLLDGSNVGNTSGYGTFDVYINGSLVANDVTDFYQKYNYGSTYEIKDIKSTTGHTYNGVSSGSLKGTITSNTGVRLKYTTNVYTVDVNGTIDGTTFWSGVGNYATFDVYLNGSLVGDDVSDYYNTSVKYGTTFAIKDVKVKAGYTYTGATGAGASGTVNGSKSIFLNFTTNSYTNTIGHWLWGFKNGEGNNSSGGAFNLGNTSFSAKYKTEFTLSDSRKVTLPNGIRLTSVGTRAIEGTWKTYSVGTKATQSAGSMHFEYNYTPITYTISYDVAGGTLASGSSTSYNVLYGVTLKEPSRAGYTFEGWMDASTGKIITGINEGATANFSSASELYTELAKRRTGNVTLTAVWEVIDPELVTRDNVYFVGDNVPVSKLVSDNTKATDVVEGDITSKVKVTEIKYKDGTVVQNPDKLDTSKMGNHEVFFVIESERGGYTTGQCTVKVYIVHNPSWSESDSNIYSRYIGNELLSDGTNALNSLEEGSIWERDSSYRNALNSSLSRDGDNYLYKVDID